MLVLLVLHIPTFAAFALETSKEGDLPNVTAVLLESVEVCFCMAFSVAVRGDKFRATVDPASLFFFTRESFPFRFPFSADTTIHCLLVTFSSILRFSHEEAFWRERGREGVGKVRLCTQERAASFQATFSLYFRSR